LIDPSGRFPLLPVIVAAAVLYSGGANAPGACDKIVPSSDMAPYLFAGSLPLFGGIARAGFAVHQISSVKRRFSAGRRRAGAMTCAERRPTGRPRNGAARRISSAAGPETPSTGSAPESKTASAGMRVAMRNPIRKRPSGTGGADDVLSVARPSPPALVDPQRQHRPRCPGIVERRPKRRQGLESHGSLQLPARRAIDDDDIEHSGSAVKSVHS
jgi:hypothetical protein